MTDRLHVEGELALVVSDADGRRTSGTLRGDDDGGVRLDVDRPEVLLGALPARSSTSDALAVVRELGIRVEVHGPRGRLAVLDPDGSSRLGALLTGEPGLRVSPRAATAWLRGPGRRVVAVAGALTALGVVAAVVRAQGRPA